MKIDFKHKQTAHCENGVISNLLTHSGLKISEPLAFGLGSGIFFVYLPFLKVNFAPALSFRPQPG
ncbi:MAG: BtrH N-terminal domain-containing protein, partial [Flavobacteriaceae bacterium]|nr:BtrH N-terminal domain-containing protein [Flavobacteriaceae bacterium]